MIDSEPQFLAIVSSLKNRWSNRKRSLFFSVLNAGRNLVIHRKLLGTMGTSVAEPCATVYPPSCLRLKATSLHQIEWSEIKGAGVVRKTDDLSINCGNSTPWRPQNNEDHAPAAHKTALVAIGPNSVTTPDILPPENSNPRTAQFVAIFTPLRSAARPIAVVALEGSARPSLRVVSAPIHFPFARGILPKASDFDKIFVSIWYCFAYSSHAS